MSICIVYAPHSKHGTGIFTATSEILWLNAYFRPALPAAERDRASWLVRFGVACESRPRRPPDPARAGADGGDPGIHFLDFILGGDQGLADQPDRRAARPSGDGDCGGRQPARARAHSQPVESGLATVRFTLSSTCTPASLRKQGGAAFLASCYRPAARETRAFRATRRARFWTRPRA